MIDTMLEPPRTGPTPGTTVSVGIPERVGGVRLSRLLGRGGMGIVYLGHHEALDIDVAVKLIPIAEHEAHRILEEARSIAQLDHPNVVRVLNAGYDQGYAYIIMEYVAGADLGRLIEQDGAMPWKRALRYALQIADGLAAAHRAGLVHCDIKPRNIMITADGAAKILDLGLARRLGCQRTSFESGTPMFLAPELTSGRGLPTPASDVYALGVTLYCMLVGSGAMNEQTTRTIRFDQATRTYDFDHKLEDRPAAVRSLVSRMMAPDPAARPADGDQTARAIRDVLDRSGTRDAIAAVGKHRQRGYGGLVAVVLAIGLGAAGTGAAWAVITHATVGDRWSTPPRAVFVIADNLPIAVRGGLDTALKRSGLEVIERQRIDPLLREVDFGKDGRAEPGSAARIGRVIGGHLAVYIDADDNWAECSVVVVETCERVGCAVVPIERVDATIERLVVEAAGTLPLTARVSQDDGGIRVDAGSHHGLRVGDRLRLYAMADGPAIGTATVSAVGEADASITADSGLAGRPALAERIPSTGAR
jgi:hypothetical protein